MIIEILTGGELVINDLSDLIKIVLTTGFDVALFVFFLNHFFDFLCGGGRYK